MEGSGESGAEPAERFGGGGFGPDPREDLTSERGPSDREGDSSRSDTGTTGESGSGDVAESSSDLGESESVDRLIRTSRGSVAKTPLKI